MLVFVVICLDAKTRERKQKAQGYLVILTACDGQGCALKCRVWRFHKNLNLHLQLTAVFLGEFTSESNIFFTSFKIWHDLPWKQMLENWWNFHFFWEGGGVHATDFGLIFQGRMVGWQPVTCTPRPRYKRTTVPSMVRPARPLRWWAEALLVHFKAKYVIIIRWS